MFHADARVRGKKCEYVQSIAEKYVHILDLVSRLLVDLEF